jgi:hypothetical protein
VLALGKVRVWGRLPGGGGTGITLGDGLGSGVARDAGGSGAVALAGSRAAAAWPPAEPPQPAVTTAAAVSTAALSTAALSTAALSTAALSTAALSTAALSTAALSTPATSEEPRVQVVDTYSSVQHTGRSAPSVHRSAARQYPGGPRARFG